VVKVFPFAKMPHIDITRPYRSSDKQAFRKPATEARQPDLSKPAAN